MRSVRFEWRKRKGSTETNQLSQIAAFIESGPQLLDLDGTRDMMCVDDLPSLLVQQMVDTAKLEPELSPHEVLQRLQAPQLSAE